MKTRCCRYVAVAVLAGGALAGLLLGGGPSESPDLERSSPRVGSRSADRPAARIDPVEPSVAAAREGQDLAGVLPDPPLPDEPGSEASGASADRRSLREIARSGALEPLLLALSPEHPRGVRREALDLLVEVAGEGAWSDLTRMAGEDADPELRAQAIGHLARLDPIAALEWIEPALSDPEGLVRRQALRSLGYSGSVRSLELALAFRAQGGDLETVRAQAFALRDLATAGADPARGARRGLAERPDLDVPTRATVRELGRQLAAVPR